MQNTEDQPTVNRSQIERRMFPQEFLWGTTTSAYQIEGAVLEDGRGTTIWDRFAATPGAIAQGDTGAIAADHYHRMDEDVTLMADLGMNAYCCSLAWSRILPTGTGAVNQKGMDFYSRLVDTLLARGITPIMKLYHWDLPLALYQAGGWTQRHTIQAFVDYVTVVAQHLGDRVPYWITHNEPWCAAFLGHGSGVHAPGEQSMQTAVDVAHHLLVSHGAAANRLREVVRSDAQIGIALNLFPVAPVDERPESRRAATLADAFFNTWFLDPLFLGVYPDGFFASLGVAPPPIHDGDRELIAVPLDFLGVNYYTRMVVRPADAGTPLAAPFEIVKHLPGAAYTSTDWEVYPQGLSEILLRLQREYAPKAMIVTESGAAFADQWQPGAETVHDPQRMAFLQEHIQAVAAARAQGAPVTGYCVWSLLDNFEWAEGYRKRFGIVYVDYPTQQRIVKASGRWYADFLGADQTRG